MERALLAAIEMDFALVPELLGRALELLNVRELIRALEAVPPKPSPANCQGRKGAIDLS